MINKIAIVVFILINFNGNAQNNSEVKVNVEDLVSNYIKELQSRKIDTICVYEEFCVGSVKVYDISPSEINDFCFEDFPNNPVYIFWKQKEKTYLTKISICFFYNEVLITENNFWDIYFSNKKIIKKEEIKKFAYIDHSCHHNFKILTDNEIIEKRFDEFDLLKEHNSHININYEHNINLKSKRIVDILEKITSEAEKNNTFKKIKSR